LQNWEIVTEVDLVGHAIILTGCSRDKVVLLIDPPY
jgi:hypothetical protein